MKLGYPEENITAVGLLAVFGTLLYAVPRTAVVGAVVLTGFLGGAMATQLRVEAPLFSHTRFPFYFALLIWGSLALRDARVGCLMSRT